MSTEWKPLTKEVVDGWYNEDENITRVPVGTALLGGDGRAYLVGDYSSIHAWLYVPGSEPWSNYEFANFTHYRTIDWNTAEEGAR